LSAGFAQLAYQPQPCQPQRQHRPFAGLAGAAEGALVAAGSGVAAGAPDDCSDVAASVSARTTTVTLRIVGSRLSGKRRRDGSASVRTTAETSNPS
jgi:hypothetical protein